MEHFLVKIFPNFSISLLQVNKTLREGLFKHFKQFPLKIPKDKTIAVQ
jgi:hypothetical protein